jgi:phosphoglycolate phosphatase-like HAD superfamily hydrolase
MKLFVWDLHGTLEQGNEHASIELSNMALERLGYTQRFTREHARPLYGLKWHEYFAHLLPEESHERHLELQQMSHTMGLKHLDVIKKHMRPTAHSLAVLQQIQAAGHDQIVISNTDSVALAYFTRILGIQPYFDTPKILAADTHLQHTPTTKEALLRTYVNGKTYHGLVIIGDSHNDMLLKTVAGGTTYLYTHPGYSYRSELGDYRIRDLRRLLEEL